MSRSRSNIIIIIKILATITYAHHSLIKGGRKGALYGSIATIILAIVFTTFQAIEYSVSSFTISDGVFGTCFFFGTGLTRKLTLNSLNFYSTNKKIPTKLSPY